MQALPFLASTTEASAHSHSLFDALPHMAGMLMVMVTLAFLWGVCALTAVLVKALLPESKPVPQTAASAPTPVPAATTAPEVVDIGIAPEIVAAIAAAVASCTGPSHRIISIKPQSTTWERAGRQSILTSHRIR
jgi:hypothetical protein